MDSESRLFLERATNELNLARIIVQLSMNQELQVEIFNVSKADTYYSAAISHAYYCIFYSAKAYLLIKRIKTRAPKEHKKVFEAFKSLVEKGIVDVELLKIYREILVKAETLLGIFLEEKDKRGKFTYKKLAQANKEPATQSVERAATFFKHIYNLCK